VTPPQLPVPAHTADEAQRAARAVLARAEFDEPPTPLLERLRDALFEFLGRLFARLLEGATGSPLGWLVVVVVVSVLAVLVVRFARGVARDPERDAGEIGATGRRRRTAPEWRAEADRLERAGQWRAALRCRYRALVAELGARGLVDEIPGRTAGEYRADVAANAPLVADAFSGATALFEHAWYGGVTTGADDAEAFRSLERRVLAGVA
jgi:hypothetical protein